MASIDKYINDAPPSATDLKRTAELEQQLLLENVYEAPVREMAEHGHR